MLGRFLEISVHSADIPHSLEFYRKLGFAQAQVGDAWNHPYAVVTDGRICIGLHQADATTPALTFVCPDILKQAGRLQSAGVDLHVLRLGDAVFNEIGFMDPCGVLVRMIEARSFSPSERKPTELSHCGYFEEIALPAPDLQNAKAFWENQGFVGLDDLDAHLPRISCTSDFIDIGLYEAAHLTQPTLIFEADDIHARISRLAAAGIVAQRNLPAALRGTPAALYIAPEGTPVLMRGITDG